MEIRDYEYVLIPNILEKYKCSMSGECCQSKWRIDVDQGSYMETKKKLESVGEDVDSYIVKNESGDYICKFSDGYCKLITEDKKCRVHKDFGWECLSDTCKVYPRSLKLTSRGVEIGLGFSCRSAAKLLLSEEKFYIKKIKKEDYFFMKPKSIPFIIPENNLSNEINSRYFELENMAIDILNLEGDFYKKVEYLRKVFLELRNEEIEKYSFEEKIKGFDKFIIDTEEGGTEEEIIKIILAKQNRSSSVVAYFMNLLRSTELRGNIEEDKKVFISNSFELTKNKLEDLKRFWAKEYDKILQNYFQCYIFNKEVYSNIEYFMFKTTILVVLLKFRILLNLKYLGRKPTEKELIYIIKSHEEDFSHDGEFFSDFYKKSSEGNIDIIIRKLLKLLEKQKVKVGIEV